MAWVTVETYDRAGNLIDTRQVERPDEEANEEVQRDNVGARLDDLRTFAGGTGNLTAAQLTTAVRMLARVVVRLALIVLGIRDRTD